MVPLFNGRLFPRCYVMCWLLFRQVGRHSTPFAVVPCTLWCGVARSVCAGSRRIENRSGTMRAARRSERDETRCVCERFVGAASQQIGSPQTNCYAIVGSRDTWYASSPARYFMRVTGLRAPVISHSARLTQRDSNGLLRPPRLGVPCSPLSGFAKWIYQPYFAGITF